MAIIPCFITFFSLHHLTKVYKDNPDMVDRVNVANNVKWLTFVIGAFLFRWLLEFNLKNSCNTCRNECDDINRSEQILG